MKLSTGFEKKRVRIEMIPLIDCMFLLLIFFVYSMLSMTIQRGLEVNLPQTHTGDINQEEYISITINSESEVFLDKEKVAIAELPHRIHEIKKTRPDWKIFINGDEAARLGIAIEILDLLRVNGIEEINFVTSPHVAIGDTRKR